MKSSALLEEVYARPLDDRPREALARALVDEGDERGWFIAAQLLEATGRLPLAQFEQLVEREARLPVKWLGPLASQVVRSRLHALRPRYRRGFASRVFADASRVDTGSPAWATIECVSPGSSADWLLEVKWPSLRELRGVTAEFLARWVDSGRARLDEVVVHRGDDPAPAALRAAHTVHLGWAGDLFATFEPWLEGGVTALSTHCGVGGILELLPRIAELPPQVERVGVSLRTATGDIDGWELWLTRDAARQLRRLTARLHPPAKESDRPRHVKLAGQLFGLLEALTPAALSSLAVEVESGYRDSFFALLESDRAEAVSVSVRERWKDARRNLLEGP